MNLTDAMVDLGLLLKDGDEKSEDREEGFKWFKTAASKGVKRAYLPVALCYFEGRGVSMDHENALYWFEKSATCGDKFASFAAGTIHMNGQAGDVNPERAVYWFREGASRGDIKSIEFLARCYETGFGVPTDQRQAKILRDSIDDLHVELDTVRP